MSGPPAGLLPSYETLGTWNRPEAASQKTASSLVYIKGNSPWWLGKRGLPAPWLPGSLAQEHPRPLLSVLGQGLSAGSSFSLSCQLPFLKQ